VTSPITNKVIWKSSSVSKDDAIKAVEAAQAAFPAWSKTKPSKRRDILLKASDILAQRAEEAAEYMEIETGAVPAYSGGFNVPSAIEQLRDVAGRIITSTGHIPICGEEGKSAMIIKEPYGVIFGIAPWFVLCYLRILWKFLTIDQECTVHSGLPRCILCARCGQHLRPQRP